MQKLLTYEDVIPRHNARQEEIDMIVLRPLDEHTFPLAGKVHDIEVHYIKQEDELVKVPIVNKYQVKVF